ncbi:IS66 family insertion sequence hypothetical protein [bacterium]|nr:IS66 family insertion sequence hypothetical protein [bacterium]
MDTKEVTGEYRLTQWVQVIRERQESGQYIKDFCSERGISRNAYFYWQRKLRKAACKQLTGPGEHADPAPAGWMQLARVNEMKSTLKIEISGCHITVDAKTDLELLKSICRTLRSV